MTDEIKWEDVTSYSQGERGKIDPTAWECRIEGIRLWVSKGHIYHRGEWVMNCNGLGIDKKHIARVEDVTKEEVFSKALTIAGTAANVRSRIYGRFALICEASK